MKEDGRVQILVVDDEATIRNLLRMMLPKHYRVAFATNGQEALDTFNCYTIDLILLDIVMPGLDGFSVCQQLRQHSDVPIIMCSALNRPADMIRAVNSGANAYITKPFTADTLRQCIDPFVSG